MHIDPISSSLASRLATYEKNNTQTVPKYQRICDVVMEMMEDGELKPGDKFPTEVNLVQALPISLGTVQKAMNKLTEQDILKRIQGSGTYVNNHNTQLHDLWHFRFIGEDGEQTLPVYTNTISVEKVNIVNACPEFANIRSFVCITRHIDLNHEFGAIGQFYLDANIYSALLDEPLHYFDGVHLRDIIFKRFGETTTKAKVRVSCQTLPDKVNNWLSLKLKTDGLVNQIVGLNYKGLPISFQNIFVPPNVRPLEIRISHPARGKH